MAYLAVDFNNLMDLSGFSNSLLKNHFTLYQGYVNNTNKVADSLVSCIKEGKSATPEYAELKRRFGWEFNGMRLHELYFGNLSKTPSTLPESSPLYKKICEEFASFENWEADFRSTGAMRGIGWVALYYDQAGKRLFNCWIGEHDVGHPSGAFPLLVMDVFEHAYMLDYGLKKADYINAFFVAIDWKAVQSRF